ncbi:phytanoyl-CoA dioxygenase family protein [Cohnella hongkongensis]|uniref:Phytanoyl-CoA dioxygenase family protein n=1 Tax=Cohnella hongkongensis TaxID=178337 RepID=A0ABV9F6E7_9BACL
MSIDNHEPPELISDYPLSDTQLALYRQDGHIRLKQVMTPSETDAYEPIISEVVRKLNHHDKPLSQRDTYGKAFIQVGNLWTKSEAIRRFTLARRFAKIAADLMGVRGVRLYHDQALFKEPGGGHTPWHQDQIYWPLDTDQTITMWMPLVPISEEIGSMTFASGTHTKGYVSRLVISDESHSTLGQYIEAKGIPQVNYGAMAPGDATFHAGWTLHSAPGNPTEHMRKVMTVIYMADDAKVIEPQSNVHRNALELSLPGCKPGEPAASPLNPVVYRRED